MIKRKKRTCASRILFYLFWGFVRWRGGRTAGAVAISATCLSSHGPPPKEMTCCRMIFYKLHSLYTIIYCRSIDCWCCSWRCPIEYLRQKADQSAGTVITDALCHQGNHTPNNKKLLKSAQVHTDSFFSINFFNPPSDFPFKLKQNRPLFHYRHWNVSKRHQLKSNR
jgi:hypothetical protein